MIKYTDTLVTFSEVPDEVALCINLTKCWFRCPECHSKELWLDTGFKLTQSEIDRLISENDGITCICFMGEGSKDTHEINTFANYIRNNHYKLKIALYTGRDIVPPLLMKSSFDYIKLGRYDSAKGPINNPKTNQRLYKIDHMHLHTLVDITNKFWNETEHS